METAKLVIDRIRETDKVDYFTNISHDKKVLETFICRYAETLEEFDFSTYLGRDDLFAIRLKETGRLIGIILYFPYEKDPDACEIGYGIGSKYWGNGYMTEAVKGFLHYLFDKKKVDRVFASFFTGNEASKRVMEKCGMHYDHFSPHEMEYLDEERDLTYFVIAKDEAQNESEFGVTYIVAGDEMQKLFSEKFPSVRTIPCRENFAVGKCKGSAFDDTFVRTRAEELGTTVEDYKEKLAPIINLNFAKEYVLVFGEDDCCRANLEFLINYLQQNGYKHPICVKIVDELTLDTIREYQVNL